VARILLSVSFLLGTAVAQAATTEPPVPSFAFLSTPPIGLPVMPMPAAYKPTEAMFDLGRKLFHDGILSKDRSVTCASCHMAKNGFAHPDALPPGVDGQRALRHAPSLFNRGYGTLQRWDGSSPSLEAFVLEPISDPREMGLGLNDAIDRLRQSKDYQKAFAAAFSEKPNPEALRRSLATFVRGIVSGTAPYDRFLRGEVDAMTPQQRHGQWIFESKGGCWKCHTPPLFTDERFHNTGIGVAEGKPEAGRADITKDVADTGRWKTPTLRSIRLTAPYMHNGSLRTLEDVVKFYGRGGNANPHLDRKLKKLDLTEENQSALVAFLRSL
jgi:cytochrome c peroxidase